MVELGVATVHFRYRDLSDDEFRALARNLFEVADVAAREFIRLDDVRVVLELEDASLRARSRIAAGAVAVGVALSNYGSIREGAVYLGNDILTAGRYIVDHLPERAGADPTDVITTRRSATLTRRIERIVREVERGHMDSEQAVKRLVKLLDPDGEGAVPPDLLERMRREFRRAEGRTQVSGPEWSTQQSLPLVVVEEFDPGRVTKRAVQGRPLQPRKVRVDRVGNRVRIREE